MAKSKYVSYIFSFLFLILIGNNMIYKTNESFAFKAESITCSNCYVDDPIVELDTFPIDLDELFWADNLTMRNYVLNEIGNGSIIWMITPWGAHFISSHLEGVDHWYLNAYRLTSFVAPHDGTVSILKSNFGTNIIDQNGTQLVEDCFLVIDIGDNCFVYFGHLNLLKSIFDEIESTGSYSFTKGEVIGLTTPTRQGVDFYYEVNERVICPLHVFTPELQAKIENYYNLQIPKAIVGGVFPQVDMCNNVSVAIENTVWGVWDYSSGYLDPYFDMNEWCEGRIITFFNRNFSNPETYYRDPKDRFNKNITADVLGIFADARGDDIPVYNKTGDCFLKEVSGNFSQGIMEIIFNGFDNDWGAMNDSIFIRYNIDFGVAGFKDDILTIDYFSDLLDAQAGFTENNLTYVRYFHWWNQEHSDEPTSEESLYLFIPFVFSQIILTLVLYKKRRLKPRSK
ncbi:MAG: hypothetical protein FK733_02130 [Asgard group archaeon]|nr:hypothetical protein [Asgard group archaeon]